MSYFDTAGLKCEAKFLFLSNQSFFLFTLVMKFLILRIIIYQGEIKSKY